MPYAYVGTASEYITRKTLGARCGLPNARAFAGSAGYIQVLSVEGRIPPEGGGRCVGRTEVSTDPPASGPRPGLWRPFAGSSRPQFEGGFLSKRSDKDRGQVSVGGLSFGQIGFGWLGHGAGHFIDGAHLPPLKTPTQNALPKNGSIRPQNMTPTHKNRERPATTLALHGASSPEPRASTLRATPVT
jgi:hypothetical protein